MKQLQSKRASFIGFQGDRLDARLDYPVDTPRAYALFAHCFTCSKDYIAATRISRHLAENDIAVLRFDFTGLGNSEGDFANTNFSSNVDDLRLASDYLQRNYQAPKILIGHSLGGTAVLAVTQYLPEVVAVATIAAPSDPQHIRVQLATAVSSIEDRGEVVVEIAGRPFRLLKQFLNDITTQNLEQIIRKLNAALMVFHSPQDSVVNIEHAKRIFDTAKHPKSFISLDKADHLLTKREDAQLVAGVLTAWVSRYLPEPESNE